MIEQVAKVTADHFRRDAYLYIRQSTVRQVFENSESTKRRYALRQRAIALGWPDERIVVIDSDLGQSGASAADREGFPKLVAEVSMGHAGLVMGLEVSRLARHCSDWHRLLELCAISGTLILDEDGCYDPADFNDALLLGIKGTMSAAELHLLRGRLLGGIQNKARRGELKNPIPVGLVYDAQDRVVKWTGRTSSRRCVEGRKQKASGQLDRFLFYLLRSNRHVIALREILEERPVRLDEVGWSLFEDEQEDSVSGVTALVDLAAPARPASDDQPLLPARYHVFVRAIEGVYICLYPRRELFLERRESFEIDEEKYRVFELAVCRQCGAAYLMGERTNAEDGKQIVKQPGPRSFEHPSGGGNSSCCWMAEPRRRPMTRTNWSRMMRYMPRRRPSGCDCACAAVPLTARMRCFPPAIAVPKSEFGS